MTAILATFGALALIIFGFALHGACRVAADADRRAERKTAVILAFRPRGSIIDRSV